MSLNRVYTTGPRRGISGRRNYCFPSITPEHFPLNLTALEALVAWTEEWGRVSRTFGHSSSFEQTFVPFSSPAPIQMIVPATFDSISFSFGPWVSSGLGIRNLLLHTPISLIQHHRAPNISKLNFPKTGFLFDFTSSGFCQLCNYYIYFLWTFNIEAFSLQSLIHACPRRILGFFSFRDMERPAPPCTVFNWQKLHHSVPYPQRVY